MYWFPLYNSIRIAAISTAAVSFPLMYRTARRAFESFDEILAQAGGLISIFKRALLKTGGPF